jgi:hypothetical protein
MGRGPLKDETKRQRSLDKALEWLQKTGVSTEQIPIEQPDETVLDKIREAQSVYYYFSTKGLGFKEKTCKNCEKTFAYKWEVDSICYCSIACAAESLKQIGIKWNPHKSQAERWGRYVPAVVPPAALEILKDHLEDQTNDSQGDSPVDISQ